MAVEGVELVVRGRPEYRAKGYSVTEDSTPVDISDTTGGTGQFTFEIDEDDSGDTLDWYGLATLVDEEVILRDGSLGVTSGFVNAVGSPDWNASVTADSALWLMNVTRQADPFEGTLEDAFGYYLALVGYTGGIVVEPSIADRPVVLMGWNGVVWDRLKQLVSAEQVEVTLASNNAVMRPLRERVAETYRDASVSPSVSQSDLARAVQIAYYPRSYSTSHLAYPSGGWTPEVPTITVNAGETRVETLEVNASLVSIEQPTCVDWVDQDHDSSSVYSVTGSDDLVIPPAQWAAMGGSLTVEIGEDTRSLIVTIVAPSSDRFSQFSIVMPSGPSSNYSSLRIVGEGVFYTREILTLDTSVDHERVSNELAPLVDNECVATLEQAETLGRWVMKRYGSLRHIINVQTDGVNRIGDDGSYVYPSIGDFNDLYSGMTVEDFNDAWAGKAIGEFNAYMAEQTASEFVNQAFGNVAGARRRFGDAMFRIRSATTAPDGGSYMAEEDTVVADFNAAWEGMTVGDFNDFWADGFKKWKDFAIAPLRGGAHV